MGFLYEVDKWFFYLINVKLQTPVLFAFFGYITEFKHWKWPIAGLIVAHFPWVFFSTLMRGGSQKAGIENVKKALIKGSVFLIMVGIGVGAGEYLNHHGLKPFFGRVRPCNVLTGVNILAPCNNSFSFPSSHCVNVVTLAVIMSFEYRLFTPIICLIAFLVCYSRVYLGVHYPSDVLAGALFGMICGGTVVYLKIKFFDWYKRLSKRKKP